ncbi:putative serine carboxypeptidase CPVL-like protein [Leptotrombidium deliense]|uniref:Putative serine carboxypeptidase CPVL-like protein n=1 Tax=Leptotrombidium deliense TaxID=299467 RepID=A0A443QR49_9ACAR|nr:putative serine carboxypeptidase CPVL-like protein [Leptotrombidium deliense]
MLFLLFLIFFISFKFYENCEECSETLLLTPLIESGNIEEAKKYSWTKKVSMLNINKPVGTGFSFTDRQNGFAKNLNESTENLFFALPQFFTMFNELRANDFYEIGESYAGKYVPAIAHKIHNEQFEV